MGKNPEHIIQFPDMLLNTHHMRCKNKSILVKKKKKKKSSPHYSERDREREREREEGGGGEKRTLPN